jgi:hypothetical protein
MRRGMQSLALQVQEGLKRDPHAFIMLTPLDSRGRSSSAAIGPSATARSTQRWTV